MARATVLVLALAIAVFPQWLCLCHLSCTIQNQIQSAKSHDEHHVPNCAGQIAASEQILAKSTIVYFDAHAAITSINIDDDCNCAINITSLAVVPDHHTHKPLYLTLLTLLI